MKLKIRKVEVTAEEFFSALTDILEVHEKIPQVAYLGSDLNEICKSLGIKMLEFWKLKFDNEIEFDNRFVLRQAGYDKNAFSLWRKELYSQVHNNNK